MNNKMILVIVIILLLIGGGYFLSQKQSKTASESVPTQETSKENTENSVSITELLGLQKTQTCTYSYSDDKAVNSQGTVFISNGKVRGDFMVQGSDASKNYTGSMINDGTYIYTWSSAAKQGMKMKISTVNKQLEDAKINPGEYMDLNKKANYKCADWQEDASVFIPPKDITFTDLSAQMKQIQNIKDNVDSMKNAPCAACDKLEGSAKDSCKAALKCS